MAHLNIILKKKNVKPLLKLWIENLLLVVIPMRNIRIGTIEKNNHRNVKGRQLLFAVQTLELHVISTAAPMYWPSDRWKIPDLIDFCITKGIANTYIKCKSLP